MYRCVFPSFIIESCRRVGKVVIVHVGDFEVGSNCGDFVSRASRNRDDGGHNASIRRGWNCTHPRIELPCSAESP